MTGIGRTEQPKLNNPFKQNGSPKYHKQRKRIKRSLWSR